MESQFEHTQRVETNGHRSKDAHLRVIRIIDDARSELLSEAKSISTAGVDFLRPVVDLDIGVDDYSAGAALL